MPNDLGLDVVDIQAALLEMPASAARDAGQDVAVVHAVVIAPMVGGEMGRGRDGES